MMPSRARQFFSFFSSSQVILCWLLLPLLVPLSSAFVVVSPPDHAPTFSTGSNTNIRTALEMARKNSNRAHIERNLEDMMGNDWREFRAKLVAQEQQQQQPGAGAMDSSSETGGNTHATTNSSSRLAKQGQLSDLFGAAISSIFHSNKQDRQGAAAATTTKPDEEDENIFDGDTVGGNTQHHKTTEEAPSPATSTLSNDDDQESTSTSSSSMAELVDDPFCTAAELPALWTTPAVKINKHRWAHALPHVEAGCVLIANEKLGGVFHQTIVLMVQHCENTGSIGVVINRPLEGNLLKIASEQASSNLDLSLKLAFSSSPVTYGGPVLSQEYSVLHGFGPVEGATKLCPGVYVGGSEELMAQVRGGISESFDPSKALFVQGHAAWVPGQLSKEIAKGVWYTAAVSADLVLRYAGAPVTDEDNANDLWADILECMGGTYADIARTHANADAAPATPPKESKRRSNTRRRKP